MSAKLMSATQKSPDDISAVYQAAYQQILGLIEVNRKNENFYYQNVYWLKALRKPLFDHTYLSLMGLQRSETPPPKAARPNTFEFGFKADTEILFFSDPEKIRAVADRIQPHSKYAYYTNAWSPKWGLYAARKGFGFSQHVYGSSRSQEYLIKARGLIQKTSLPADLARLSERYLPKMLFDIDQAHAFFSKHPSIRAVLMDEDATTSKNAFAQIARQFGVRTYVLCHGVMGHPNGFLPLEADHFFAWGTAQKKKLVRWGAEAHKILVSGCVRYEQYACLDHEKERTRLVRRYHFDGSRPIAILAPPLYVKGRHAQESQFLSKIDAMFEAMEKLPDIQWLVKLHAGDTRASHYRRWLEERKGRFTVKMLSSGDPYPLIAGSDLVFAYYSTFAVDGFALKKDVVLMRDANTDIYEEYRDYPVFLDVSNADEAVQAIRAVLNKEPGRTLALIHARQDCLNEGGISASEFIVKTLLSSAKGGAA